ncbi:Uncharacterized protein APZ42_025993 [Daphnia magna]|uniref:Reverse transcriptase domain-containing protein n=1 Tax=Daphnia magna TaxID=35525 RepID=A0A164SKC2_9CRUS|nr:Uncharacterized protein APZ42_025993 [Daphnia magna]
MANIDQLEKVYRKQTNVVLEMATPLLSDKGTKALRTLSILWAHLFREITHSRRINILTQTQQNHIGLLSSAAEKLPIGGKVLFRAEFVNELISQVKNATLVNNSVAGPSATSTPGKTRCLPPPLHDSRNDRSNNSFGRYVKLSLVSPIDLPVAGRTARFVYAWARRTRDPWYTTERIDGCCSAESLFSRGGVSHQKGCGSRDGGEGGYISTYFLVPKKGPNEWRPIIYLKPLNQFLCCQHFKMERIVTNRHTVTQGNFLARVDLTDAYFTIPIFRGPRKYLRCRLGRKTFKYTCFPSGLCGSPWVFTKLLKVAVTFLRRSGIRLVIYLDDLLIVGTTVEECSNAVAQVINVLESLGFLINFNKFETVPTQCIEYIGLITNSVSITVCLTDKKICDICRLCIEVLKKGECSLRQLAKKIGNPNWASFAVNFAQAHFHSLQATFISSSQANNNNLDTVISLNENIRADLKWWTTTTNFISGIPLLLSRPGMRLPSDASLSGWGGGGAVCLDVKTDGPWSRDEFGRHIVTVWLYEGVTLGTVQTYSEDELDEETNSIPNITEKDGKAMDQEEATIVPELNGQIAEGVTKEQREQLTTLLLEYIQCFAAEDPEKILAVKNFPSCEEGKTTAEKVKRVQSFLGLCSYYRKHLKNFEKIAKPLTLLIKQDTLFVWEMDQKDSFGELKNGHGRKALKRRFYRKVIAVGTTRYLEREMSQLLRPHGLVVTSGTPVSANDRDSNRDVRQLFEGQRRQNRGKNATTSSTETRTEDFEERSTQNHENKTDPVENIKRNPVEKTTATPIIFRNDRGTVTDLPPRGRNRPNYLVLVLPYLLCVLVITVPTSTDAVLIPDTVLFQEKPGVVLSESLWTIITDLDLSPAETAVTVLENKLQEYVEVAARHRKDGINFMKSDSVNSWRDTTSFMIAEKIEHKLNLFSYDLEVSKKRLTTFRAAIGGDLQAQTEALKTVTKEILNTMQQHEVAVWSYLQYLTHLDTAFDSISNWTPSTSNPPPPAELAALVEAMNAKLPLGWAVPTEDLWVTYREARVSVVVVNEKFRLLIEVPIYDHSQQYSLYGLIRLPKATDNGTHGIQFNNLPDFLAMIKNKQQCNVNPIYGMERTGGCILRKKPLDIFSSSTTRGGFFVPPYYGEENTVNAAITSNWPSGNSPRIYSRNRRMDISIYILGTANVLTDAESRRPFSAGDWRLSPTAFMSICLQWPVQVDLFASEWNHQLPRFVSWFPQPKCWKVETFSLPWKGFDAFCFPPFSLISFCLSKLMEEEPEAVLVTPYWLSQPWFPIIMDLAVAAPRRLRPSSDLLTSPLGMSHPLVQDDSIRLIAWKLSGSALLRAEFPKTLQPSSSPQHEKIQTLHTRPPGIFGEIRVLRGKRIPCLIAAQM